MSDQYNVGDVVNGHRWDGSQWLPVTDASAGGAGAAGPPPNPPGGSGKSWYKRWWGIAIIVLGVLFVIGLIAGGSGSEKSTTASGDSSASTAPTKTSETAKASESPIPSQTAKASETAEASQTPTPSETAKASESAKASATPTPSATAAGINTPVRDGKFEFTVTGVQPGVPSVGGDYGQTAQGSYTLVTMKVTNIGDKPQTFFDSNVVGYDSQGRQHAVDSTAGIYANDQAQGFINEINPGNSSTAVLVYDLPSGETLTKLIAKDSSFSKGATINLG